MAKPVPCCCSWQLCLLGGCDVVVPEIHPNLEHQPDLGVRLASQCPKLVDVWHGLGWPLGAQRRRPQQKIFLK